ncbi:hypothetical protein [Streptomyces scopuliridis]|uniref:hypothetical protein n=1 Tax=Streptomyces scopuliridis TaxID=452529 RepID=UPI00367EB0F2
MRISHVLTNTAVGAVMGAALLTGGTVATAHAAAEPSSTSAPVTASTASTWVYAGTFRNETECYNFGRASAHRDWECRPSATYPKYQLWVDTST